MKAIELEELSRSYRTRSHLGRATTTEAVRSVSFAVEEGSIFGLLGPNGAGKTTTIRMLATLLVPTAGRAHILGHDVTRDLAEVRRSIGVVFGGDRGLYDRLSAFDNLRYFADLYEVDPRIQKRRIAELVDLVGLSGREKERVEGFSRGMRQRLHIARGLIHAPQVLLLDEPTIGVDPVGARDLRRLVSRLNDAGTTILLTTHYMHEAESLCDRVAVISEGQVLIEETPKSLARTVPDGTVLEIEIFGISDSSLSRLRGLSGVESVSVQDRGPAQEVRIGLEHGSKSTAAVLAELSENDLGRVNSRTATLEDAYVNLVKDSD